ncbi:hypothetical protein Dimus_004517 [Dionaea muscipula]
MLRLRSPLSYIIENLKGKTYDFSFRWDTLGKKAMPMEWTDEKHSLYLKSMEASFVDQLYNSISSIGGRWQKGHDSDVRSSKRTNTHMAGQKLMNFVRAGPPPEEAAEPEHQFLLENPWIRHFRPEDRKDVPFVTSQESMASGNQLGSSGRMKELKSGFVNMPMQSHHDALDNNEGHSRLSFEVSDQNFIDEDELDEVDEEDGGDHRTRKRSKTSESAASSGGHVVQFIKNPAGDYGFNR